MHMKDYMNFQIKMASKSIKIDEEDEKLRSENKPWSWAPHGGRFAPETPLKMGPIWPTPGSHLGPVGPKGPMMIPVRGEKIIVIMMLIIMIDNGPQY